MRNLWANEKPGKRVGRVGGGVDERLTEVCDEKGWGGECMLGSNLAGKTMNKVNKECESKYQLKHLRSSVHVR